MRIFLLVGAAALAACSPSAPDKGHTVSADESEDSDASIGAMVDPASKGSALEVATRYVEAIGAGRLGEAYGLLAPGSGPAGSGAADFAGRFKARTQLRMTIGEAGETVDGEVSRLVEVPATLTGTGPYGEAFSIAGPIVLQVAEKSPSGDQPPRWRIIRTPLPPAEAAQAEEG